MCLHKHSNLAGRQGLVAYRHFAVAADAKQRLSAALEAVLGKPLSAGGQEVGASNSRPSDW